MASRLLVFDHFCNPIGELFTPTTTPRSWVLNDYGRAEFSIGFDATAPQSSQEAREELLQFGNLIHIVHIPSKDENGVYRGTLPEWTGIILPPRRWDLGVIHVTAYSAEAILQFRALKYQDVKGVPGVILKKILDIVNERASNIVFQRGIVDDFQLTYPDILRTNAYDHIKKLVRDSKADWDVTGKVDANGNLNFYVNLYTRKGQEINLILDSSNTELQSPLFEEQGTPYNQIFGYSQAQTERSRFGPIESIHQGSYDDYGPLQLNQISVGKKDPTSVGNSIDALSESRGRPSKRIVRTALDKNDLFTMLEVGNTLVIRDNTVGFNSNDGYGFESTAKILGMNYNELTNKVPLNLEVE